MPYETDFDTAFTILLGKAQGTIVPTPVPTPTPIPTSTARVVNIPFYMGADGTAIASGARVTFRLGLNATSTVISWSLAGFVNGASSSGTITVDVFAASSLGSLASITNGGAPALAPGTSLVEQDASGWNTIPDPSWIQARVTSTGGTLHTVSLTLRVLVE